MQVRQGDVLLVPVGAIPATANPVPLEQGRIILAHGEATGHHHSFAADAGVTLLEDNGVRYLSVERVAPFEHQEHAAIPTQPGNYQVIRQREFDDAAEWRQVAD